MKKRELFFAYLKKYRKVYLDALFYAVMLAIFVAVWLDKIFIGLQYNKILVFFVSLFILYAPSSLIFMKKCKMKRRSAAGEDLRSKIVKLNKLS